MKSLKTVSVEPYPLFGESAVGLGWGERDLCFLNFDSGQAETVIKLGGDRRWVRRWQSSNLVEAHVGSGGGIHQVWWTQALSLTEAGLWFSSSFVGLIQLSFLVVVSSLGVVPSCVFVSSSCIFVTSPCIFVSSPCVFVFANLLWFSFVVLIVEICLLPIFLFVFLAIS